MNIRSARMESLTPEKCGGPATSNLREGGGTIWGKSQCEKAEATQSTTGRRRALDDGTR